jgi:hypothetical protein
LLKAANLINHIQTNSDGAVTVESVEEWNPVGQNYSVYAPGMPPVLNFNLHLGGVYRVATSGVSGSVVWSLVGKVPPPGAFTYSLYRTDDSDMNWIMQPLDKGIVINAAGLEADLESNSSPAGVVVDTIEAWNVAGQNYSLYIAGVGIVNFPIQIGYPYRVTLNDSSPTTSSWPVR